MVRDILLEAIMGDATRPQRVAIWRAALFSLLLFHVIWALGWIPGFATGFVRVGDLHVLHEDVEALKAEQLGHTVTDLVRNIEAFQERVCKALKDNNHDVVRYAVRQRNDHIREYSDLVGKEVPVPTCKELGLE